MADDELQDAMEALEFARAQYRKIEADIAKQNGGGAAAAAAMSEAARQRAIADGSFRRTDVATNQLSERVSAAKQQLRTYSAHSSNANNRMLHHLDGIDGELHLMEDEVRRLTAAVAVMEQSCGAAQEETRGLEGRMAEAVRERDTVVAALHRLMQSGKDDVQQLRAEIGRQEHELGRLEEQNAFLRLQAVGKQR